MNDRHKKSSVLFMPSGCLTGDTLMLYVSGSLKDPELTLAKRHLADCPLCADAADGLSLWLAEDKSGTAGTSGKDEKFNAELTAELSVEPRNESPGIKPLNKFHVRTDILNQHIKQRLHAHALIEENENKRLSYKPFVWMAAAATIVLFIGSFYVLWIQTQSDRQKLALQAVEMEKAAHIEDSLLKTITDTAEIYVLALNRKSRTEISLRFNVPELVEIASDADILNQDDLSVNNYVMGDAAENEIAYATKDERPASPEKNDTNQPTELAGVAISASKVVTKSTSLGYAVQEIATEDTKSEKGFNSSKKSRQKPAEIVEDQKAVFMIVEEMPSFPGGEAERNKFLSENIHYPQLAVENSIQGTVYISFIVKTDGHIDEVKILRGIGGGCDEEALRVVGKMPRWISGRQNGKPVNVLFNMPIYFRLTEK